MKVAFQGEAGAFSEEAVFKLHPDSETIARSSFESVFESVSDGSADRGVIPIENSLHGSVHQNYDLLREHELRIVAEIQLRIRHNLLAIETARMETIRSVCSHPQALGQCRTFLKNEWSDVEIVAVYDTAGAARMVAERCDSSRAAIASARAGEKYGLITLAEGIESNHQNYTRFLSLARADDASRILSDVDHPIPLKTSIVYAQRENIPGSLFKSLAVFALRDIDLYKIESRPLIGSPGKYLFYVDHSGSTDDEPVRNALQHLEEVAATVKVLGTYPVGPTLD